MFSCAIGTGRRRRGFTLVELLVVLAVIALLASLLLPAVAGSVERARTLRCAVNLQHISIAMSLFGEDNRRFPTNGLSELQSNLGYPSGDYPTARTMPALFCPSTLQRYPAARTFTRSTYSQNNYCAWYDLLKTVQPDGCMMYVDGAMALTMNYWHLGAMQAGQGFPAPVHGDGAMNYRGILMLAGQKVNVAFGDGHVRALLASSERNESSADNGFVPTLRVVPFWQPY